MTTDTPLSTRWRIGRRVAIVGGGPGAISTALAFLSRGYDVRVFERRPTFEPIGGAVLLNTPVLAILRSYGIDVTNLGEWSRTHFQNRDGTDRVILPFNSEIERKMGIKGWHYGVLRSTAFQRMFDQLPDGITFPNHEFVAYDERANEVELRFKDPAQTCTADILVGADGIRSRVSRQAFGDPKLFHTGIRLWLAWCEQIEDVPPHKGMISHDWQYQASYFPMTHDDGSGKGKLKPGFEWWIVEPSYEGMPIPDDPKAHVTSILKGWADPMPRFVDATDFDNQVFRWEIYNRPSQKKWSRGRIVCIGDAIHPVSPYAAYGMGMAIEDGYYLAKLLDGVDLTQQEDVTRGFCAYENQRVDFVNHNMEFARRLGYLFHKLPWPLAKLRDVLFDRTPLLSHFLTKGYLEKSEIETAGMTELHVKEDSSIAA